MVYVYSVRGITHKICSLSSAFAIIFPFASTTIDSPENVIGWSVIVLLKKFISLSNVYHLLNSLNIAGS